jgi:PAS domain S-box-containing protein
LKQRDDWHLTDIIGYEQGRADPFAAAVRATRMPMVITDPSLPDNPIVFCNVAFQTLTGYDREEIIGRNCRFLQGPETDRTQVARVRAAIAQGHDVDVDLLNYRKDGTTFWNALYLSPVRNEEGRIAFYFASQLDVSDRVAAQHRIAEQKELVEREVEARTADLASALAAKTLLLHEVDHRVKNNLTMIGALLRLQARTIEDPVIGTKLETMLHRVDALATVHRRLYQSENIMKFDVAAFAENLLADVIGASGRSDIALEARIEPVEVSSSRAAALGLILNEVVTNAVRHGYADGRAGRVTLSARCDGDRAVIEVADDGPGPGTIVTRGPRDGLGRLLIERLSRQVDATTEWTDTAPGTRVTITFPLEDA